MRDDALEEVELTVREILSMITEYLDDVSIHMTSHKANETVRLRMSLAERGLELLEEQVRFVHVQKDEVLREKRAELWRRYEMLQEKINTGMVVPTEEEE